MDKNIKLAYVEFAIMLFGLIAMQLVKLVSPEFKWFMEQPVVVITMFTLLAGAIIYKGISVKDEEIEISSNKKENSIW